MDCTLEDESTKLAEQGRYREAIRILHTKRNSAVKSMGCKSYDSLLFEVKIAKVLCKQGRYNEALSMFIDAEKKLSEFPNLAPLKKFYIKMDIANVYHKKCMYICALPIYEEVYKSMDETLGPNHPITLEAKTCIGKAQSKLGKHGEALSTFNELYSCITSNQGNSQIKALFCRLDIANVYLNQCKYDEAIKIFQEAYDILNERDPNSWSALLIQCNLASVLKSQRKYGAAFQLYGEVYLIAKEKIPSHPETLNMLQSIAQIFEEQGNEAALLRFKQLHSIRNVECPMHPDTLLAERHITTILLKQEEYAEAEYFFNTMLSKISVLHGFDSDLSLEVQQNVAFILFHQEKYRESLKIFYTVYHIQSRRRDLGPDHTDALLTKIDIGETYRALSEYEKATKSFKDVLEKISTQSDDDVLAYVGVQRYIAATYSDQREFDEVFDVFNEMYEKQAKLLGLEHPETLKTKTNMDRLNNEAPQTILVASIIENIFSSVKFYIDIMKKDVNEQDYKGCTPLHIASGKGHTNIVKFLLGKGAFYNIKNKRGETPMDLSANGEIKKLFVSIERVFASVKKGTRNVSKVVNTDDGTIINAKDKDGNTLLHLASLKGYANIVKNLLNRGADPTSRNRAGDTLLHTAVMNDHKEIVEIVLLHAQGTNTSNFFVNAQSNANSMTPLHMAVLNGNLQIVKMLLDHGANVTSKMKPDVREKHVE